MGRRASSRFRSATDLVPITTLHVDIEGGYGGSSISLFQLLSRIDRRRLSPVVVHGKAGPVSDWYARIGIPAYHVPEICSFVPRNTKALKNFIATLPRMRHLDRAARNIAEIARRYDAKLVHLNYEGLFLLAERLHAHLDVPMIAHSRAHFLSAHGADGSRAGWRARCATFFLFRRRKRNAGRRSPGSSRVPGEVMWNIARDPLPRQENMEPPEVIYLGNLAWSKGTDRIVDIALACKRRHAPPFTFAIYGESRLGDRFDLELQRKIESSGCRGRGAIARPHR